MKYAITMITVIMQTCMLSPLCHESRAEMVYCVCQLMWRHLLDIEITNVKCRKRLISEMKCSFLPIFHSLWKKIANFMNDWLQSCENISLFIALYSGSASRNSSICRNQVCVYMCLEGNEFCQIFTSMSFIFILLVYWRILLCKPNYRDLV